MDKSITPPTKEQLQQIIQNQPMPKDLNDIYQKGRGEAVSISIQQYDAIVNPYMLYIQKLQAGMIYAGQQKAAQREVRPINRTERRRRERVVKKASKKLAKTAQNNPL